MEGCPNYQYWHNGSIMLGMVCRRRERERIVVDQETKFSFPLMSKLDPLDQAQMRTIAMIDRVTTLTIIIVPDEEFIAVSIYSYR
jgi:hypothetical protein